MNLRHFSLVFLIFAVLLFRSGHAAEVGNVSLAPEISLDSVAGSKWELAHLRGKVVLLHFWATWCPTCVLEMKDIQKLEKEYGDKGLVVVGISVSNKKDTVAFLSKNKITFQNVIDRFGKVTNDYGVTAFPTHLLIDRKGRIIKKWVGKQDWSGPDLKKVLLDHLR